MQCCYANGNQLDQIEKEKKNPTNDGHIDSDSHDFGARGAIKIDASLEMETKRGILIVPLVIEGDEMVRGFAGSLHWRRLNHTESFPRN